MQIKVDINRLDYWNFNKYSIRKIPSLRRNFILNMIALPILVFIGFLFLRILFQMSFPLVLIVSIVGGIIGDLLLLYMMKLQIMKLPEDKEGLLGEHIIEISEEGIRESTSVNTGFNIWNGVHGIDQDKDYIYIFLDSMLAHIIPKKSFQSMVEANEFYNKTVHYWKNGRNDN